jgi:hypothetical protein
MRRENVAGGEDNLFVLRILDESDPLDGLVADLESEPLVSWALLVSWHMLGLNELDRGVLQAVHSKTGVLVAYLKSSSFS